MDISLVIEQLRRYCPELGGRVGGAADFETGVESVIAITDPATGKFVYPAAVVIPLEDETGSNDMLDGNPPVPVGCALWLDPPVLQILFVTM